MQIVQRLREEPRPVRFLASRLLWRLGVSKYFVATCRGFRLRFFPTSLSAQYWVDPDVRAADEDLIMAYLRPGETVVDVGANIGALSLVASAAVAPGGRVIAIEAHPRTFEFLQHNLALNARDNVQPLNYAVGAAPGTLSFSDKRSDDQNAVETDGALQVPVETLDSLLAHVPGPVSLLKVDVEGFERFVFEGAGQVLQRTECVYYESWERHFSRYGCTTGEVISLLERHGFGVYRRDRGRIERVMGSYVSTGCDDLLAVRDISRLRGRLARLLPE